MDHILNINTILHTKDGRKIGNAIVTGLKSVNPNIWEVTTDYGNKVTLTSKEIEEFFYIAFADSIDFTCNEMQQMMQETHKYRSDLTN